MKLSQATNRVIDLARKVYDYYSTELPKRLPKYPLESPEDEPVPPPPEEGELKMFLEALPEDLLFQLLLIAYLGRGEFGPDELAGQFEKWKGTPDGREYALATMLHMATLGDELADGLEELGKQKIHVDKLPWRNAKVRKR